MPPPRSAAGTHASKAAAGEGATWSLLTPAVLSLTGFFVLMALSNGALQNFSVVSLMATQGLTPDIRQLGADGLSGPACARRAGGRLAGRPH